MRINRFALPLVAILALIGTALAAQAASLWTTSGRTAVNPEQLAPADIKGWMTLQQVIEGLPISQDELYTLAKIPGDVPPAPALKDLEEVVSVTELRDMLTSEIGTANMAGSDEPGRSEATLTPIPATPAPAVLVAATPDAATTHTGTATGPTPLPTGQILPANQIKGRMTLREVSDQCAVPLDQLLASLKLAPDTDPNTALKDLIGADKLTEVTEVQQVVGQLQE